MILHSYVSLDEGNDGLNHHAINGNTHYFLGHFQKQTVELPVALEDSNLLKREYRTSLDT